MNPNLIFGLISLLLDISTINSSTPIGSWIGEFMVEKSGVEKSGVEKSRVGTSYNQQLTLLDVLYIRNTL